MNNELESSKMYDTVLRFIKYSKNYYSLYYLSLVYNNLGISYLSKKIYDKAFEYISKSYTINMNNNYNYLLLMNYISYSKYYFYLYDNKQKYSRYYSLNKMCLYAKKGLKLGQELKAYGRITPCTYMISVYYKIKKDYKKRV